MHAQFPGLVADLFNMNGIIKIARVIRIDRNDEFVAQIFATMG